MENRNNNGEEHVSSGQSSGGSPYVPSDDPRQKYFVNGYDPNEDNTKYYVYRNRHKMKKNDKKNDEESEAANIFFLTIGILLAVLAPFILLGLLFDLLYPERECLWTAVTMLS